MTEKRFITGGYKIYDTYKDEEYLVNNVDAQRIVDAMNNLDTKAREIGKALSKLQIQFNNLQKKLSGEFPVQDYHRGIHMYCREMSKEELEEQNQKWIRVMKND